MRCAVIDDEPLAAAVIVAYLNKLEGYSVEYVGHHAVGAFNALQKQPIDLLFMDIQMPEITGLEFIKGLSNPPKVIFTTAYREFALDGFELNAVDYLLKPVSFDRFLKALSKIEMPTKESADSKQLDQSDEPYVYIKVDKKMVKIPLREILFVESIKDYVKVVTKAKVYISYMTLSYTAARLPISSFLRVHKSFVVNMENINTYTSSEIEIEKNTIPIGRHYKQAFVDRVKGKGL